MLLHVMMNVHTCACNIAAGILHQVIMHVHVSTHTYMPLYAELEPQGGIWMTANGYRLTVQYKSGASKTTQIHT